MNEGYERPSPRNAITRKRFLAGAGSLLVLGAVGCGGVGRGGGSSSGGGPVETRTIAHKYGTTEISGTPERVLSLGFSDQDPILALGVTPIAVRYWFGDEPNAIFPWASDELGDAQPEVLRMEELNFERIAALNPDLIVGTYSGITEDEYGTLSELAPTVAQSGEYIDYGMPWEEVTMMIGRALGREDRARGLVSEVEGGFRTAKREHPEFVGASVVAPTYTSSSEIGFFATEDPRSRFFTSLGFEIPEELDEIAGDRFYGTISGERLDLLDTDVVVWNQLAYTDGGRDTIESDPLVKRLDASREGRMIFLDGDLDNALGFCTVLSLPLLLDKLVPQLVAALDGDPGG
jgi:iron complex transport system substrate-binding protein